MNRLWLALLCASFTYGNSALSQTIFSNLAPGTPASGDWLLVEHSDLSSAYRTTIAQAVAAAGGGGGGVSSLGGATGAISLSGCTITSGPTLTCAGGGGSPGGSSGQVQFNNSGAFGGLTNAQLTALINSFSSSLPGAVPLSGGGTTNFLRADGTWAVPPGTGGGSGVSSFNTRTGAITPASGDYTVSQVTGAAALASPTFTGVPAGPTATVGTNTTQLATTAFVLSNGVSSFNTRVGAITLSSGDVTTALGFTPSPVASPTFTGIVTIPSGASISGFAPLASPALTGAPTAPTATVGDNTTKIATTAYVQANVGSGGTVVPGVPVITTGLVSATDTFVVNIGGSGGTTKQISLDNLFTSVGSGVTSAPFLYTNSSGTLLAGTCGTGITCSGGTLSASGSGSGTVTSVGLTTPGGIFSASGSPVTTTGSLGLVVAGTSGGIPYFSSASVAASSGALTQNGLMLGGGAGGAPTTLGSLGTTSTVLHGNASSSPSFGAVALGSDVSGNLPVANLNSGTGASSSTAWFGDGTWKTPSGGGNVSNVGTPTSGQIGGWTGSTTLQGLTLGTNLSITGTTLNASGGGGSSTSPIVNQTAGYTLVGADASKLENFTCATACTATLTAPATLGAGWTAFVQNAMTGTTFANKQLTITPASGTIDGVSSVVTYPGDQRQIRTDGTNFFTTLIVGGSVDILNSDTSAGAVTIPIPTNGITYRVMAWGAGGGGGGGHLAATSTIRMGGSGGGGGVKIIKQYRYADIGPSVSATVGAGGAGGTGGATPGSVGDGANTVFSTITAFAGRGGAGTTGVAGLSGGAGGGGLSQGTAGGTSNSVGGNPGGGAVSTTGVLGSAGGGSSSSGNQTPTEYGGASGGGALPTGATGGGSSLYGGPGGAGGGEINASNVSTSGGVGGGPSGLSGSGGALGFTGTSSAAGGNGGSGSASPTADGPGIGGGGGGAGFDATPQNAGNGGSGGIAAGGGGGGGCLTGTTCGNGAAGGSGLIRLSYGPGS